MEIYQYRGYQIEARREWSNWCVSVYRTRQNCRSCRNQLCTFWRR